jgi:hypothetical protein
MDPKYAVYVVIVEDTNLSDEVLADTVDTLERVGNDLSWADAEALVKTLEAAAS